MSVYTDNDSKLLTQNIETILKSADDLSSKIIKPTKDDILTILNTVMHYIIKKKRKLYGGFALNKLIGSVNFQDKFYSDDDINKWDIDFYSPTPMDDAKEITILLHNKGFKFINAREAQHDETYTIFAETKNIADITYVPTNIYNSMQTVIINELYITGPHFMMIDYFRVITDPLTSYHRLEKTFTRLCLMMKHFPLPTNTTQINFAPPTRDLNIAFNTVHKFLIDKKTIVVVGMYAFNHLVNEVNNMFIDINYYEIISTYYKMDAKELILTLQKKFPTGKTRITYKECYPFFQYLGYSVDIFFDNIIICRMYHYNTKCIPYFDVPAYYFTCGSYNNNEGNIRIGSFATQLLYNLINVIRSDTNNDVNTKNLYYNLIAHMIKLKTQYIKKTNKTIFDESLFQEFVLRCVGETMTPQMEKAMRIDAKIKKGLRYSWCFNPINDKDVNNTVMYNFKNSTGNYIVNKKNCKIDITAKILTNDIIIYDE